MLSIMYMFLCIFEGGFMQKIYTFLFATTCFSYSAWAQPLTVTSFSDLILELENNETASVVFNATGIQNINGYLTVKEDQSVDLENISSWKNSNQTFEISGNEYTAGTIPSLGGSNPDGIGKERLIMNYGSLSIKGADIHNNDFLTSAKPNNGYAQWGAAFIQNKGVITELSNVTVRDNNIDTLKKHDFWGGLISNLDGGEIQSIKDSSFSNNEFLTQQSAPHGAVIYNGSNIGTIENVVFENNVMQAFLNNSGGEHGTTIDNNQYGVIKKIANVKFINNGAQKTGENASGHVSGSAIDNYHIIEKIDETEFKGNFVFAESKSVTVMGGAIKNLYYSDAQGASGRIDEIINVDFIDNYAKNTQGEAYGGAFSTGDGKRGLTTTKKMVGVTFKGNYAQGDGIIDATSGGAFGGAIYNTGNIGELNGVFDGNKALSKNVIAYGGAIWNGGTLSNIKDSSFTDNIAKGGTQSLGGAIYNTGSISFAGTNIFNGNKTGDTFNDIHNDGRIAVEGDLTLDGGITGSGDITFKEGSSLTAELTKTTILANSVSFEGSNNITFKVNSELQEQEYDFITASLSGVENVNVMENLLYDLELTDLGKVVVAKKELSRVEADLSSKLDDKSAKIITAVLMAEDSSENSVKQISSSFADLIQERSYQSARSAAYALAPSDSGYVKELSKSVNTLLLDMTNRRIGSIGRSGGNNLNDTSLWVKGVYNQSEKEKTSTEGFKMNTTGIVLGADRKFNDITVGVGYAYTNTDADIGQRETTIDGHNFFVYGNYQPNRWFVDLLANIGYNKYKEKKYPMDFTLRSEFDVKTYSFNLMVGYDFENGLTPLAGVRYLSVHQDSYFDGLQQVGAENDEVLTAVMGSKYTHNFDCVNGVHIQAVAQILATYDIVSDDNYARVSVLDGGTYQIEGDSLAKFGVEGKLGVTATMNNFDVGLDYLGGFKKDYQNHTGVIKATYHF